MKTIIDKETGEDHEEHEHGVGPGVNSTLLSDRWSVEFEVLLQSIEENVSPLIFWISTFSHLRHYGISQLRTANMCCRSSPYE